MNKPPAPCAVCGDRPRRRSTRNYGRECSRCNARRRRVSEGNRKTVAKAGFRYGRRQARGAIWACLTRDEWEALYRAQGGRCAITGQPLRNRYDPADKTRTVAALDHNHVLERKLVADGVEPTSALRQSVRGLLGWWANRHVLPALRDDPEIAARASDYLTNPPAPRILGQLC